MSAEIFEYQHFMTDFYSYTVLGSRNVMKINLHALNVLYCST